MKFKTIKASYLRNESHFQMHRDIISAAEEFDPEAMRIAQPLQAYKACFEAEDLAFKKIAKSAYTKQIEEADSVRDECWSGLVDAVNAAGKRPSPELKRFAYELRIVLKTYGDVPRKTLNGETAAIDNAAQELESAKYLAAVEATGIRPWLDDLKAANNAFKGLVNARYDEAAGKCSIQMKNARTETDKAYKTVMEHISAFVLAFGKAAYEGFATKHNLIIAKYNAELAHTGSRNGNAQQGQDEDEDT